MQALTLHTLLLVAEQSDMLLNEIEPGPHALYEKGIPCSGPLIQVQLPSDWTSCPPIQAWVLENICDTKAFSEDEVIVARNPRFEVI